ncbi:hydrogenase 4 subunit B, partial [Vibrio alginolyticus]|nr:hydrogenase 4 subunit B [Vibrio alginolyticus]
MTSLELLLWSVALYTAGGFISLLFKQQEKMAVGGGGVTAIAGGILGLFSAVPVLMSGETLTFFAQGPFPFAHFVVRLDSLAAFMVMVISLLVTVSALYSLNYVQEYLGRGAWSMGF